MLLLANVLHSDWYELVLGMLESYLERDFECLMKRWKVMLVDFPVAILKSPFVRLDEAFDLFSVADGIDIWLCFLRSEWSALEELRGR